MRRSSLLGLLALGGCSSLAPKYIQPLPAVLATLPASSGADDAALARLTYRDLFRDPRLLALIDAALANNQNLRATIANVEGARALYRIQRAQRLPQIGAGGGVSVRGGGLSGNGGTGSNLPSGTTTGTGTTIGTTTGTGTGTTIGTGTGTTTATGTATTNGASSGGTRTNFSADIGASQFEIDLFGRVASLSNAALATYLASEAGARAVRLTLVADVADAYLTHATDASLLGIARETVTSAGRSVVLTRARLNGGVAPRTDLRQAETVFETARADVAALEATVERDRNALSLLVGATVTAAEVANDIAAVDPLIAPPPPALDSSVLLRRPDVVGAEYRLRAANARIGAARAAFFPRISLTGLAGLASTALTGLFSGGAFTYQVAPSISVPVFDGGASRGNLAYARSQFDVAQATYQATIQTAFRDVADALATRATIGAQAAAVGRLEAAARDSATLTDARYRGGVASFLESLDAQRTLYSARRQLTNARLLRARSGVALYRALGADPLFGQSAALAVPRLDRETRTGAPSLEGTPVDRRK